MNVELEKANEFVSEATLSSVQSALQQLAPVKGWHISQVSSSSDTGDANSPENNAAKVRIIDVAHLATAEDGDGNHTYTLQVAVDSSSSETSSASINEAAKQIAWSLATREYGFVSTRAAAKEKDLIGFMEAVRNGLSSDGGLYLPIELPKLTEADFKYLVGGAKEAHNTYHRTAQYVLEKIIGTSQRDPSNNDLVAKDVPKAEVVADFLSHAYVPSRWNELHDDISPLTPLLNGLSSPSPSSATTSNDHLSPIQQAHKSVYVLEQYHGPTAAFKDFALQLFPCFFRAATEGDGKRYLILAATSGDTGVAAINGFLKNASPDTQVMVLFPEHGVSPVQKAQMLSYNDGKRVQSIGLEGDFDLCQTIVKRLFNDASLAQTLRTTGEQHGGLPIELSSANSINWGRVLPQIVYYVHSYITLIRRKEVVPRFDSSSSSTKPHEFDVVVPTGNFGNILSCYIAKQLGVPVRRFVLASNENDVLFDFISTGAYDISDRKLKATISPSIDILKASNVERFLYYVLDGDTATVAKLLQDLDTRKRFELPPAVFEERVKPYFWASRCPQERCRATIKELFDASNGTRLLDPHSGVAAAVLSDYVAYLTAQQQQTESDHEATSLIPLVLVSTAHWGKFPEPVLTALEAPIPEAQASQGVADFVRAMHEAIATHCPNAQPLPKSLVDAVEAPQVVAPVVVDDPSYERISSLLVEFAAMKASK